MTLLEKLADLAPPRPEQQARLNGGRPFDVEHFLSEHNISVARTGPWQSGTKWVLETCPCNPDHTDASACIVQFPGGAVSFKCHHNGCAGNDWAALRRLYGEEAAEKKLASAPTQGIGGGGQLFKPVRADILATSEPEETSWTWEGYAPQGGLVLFCAPPKTGKTTLAYHLAGAVSEGRPFLGQTSTKSPVLILAVEERRQDAANRARGLGLGDSVYLHTGPLRADAIPAIASFVMQERIGLIIIDTLPRFWVLDSENDASMVNLAMGGVLALARDTNAAVFLLYHLRKSPGTGDGEEIRGSGDIFAQVDVALIMRRRKDQPNQRTVKSFSRYDATPEEIVIALEDGEYVSLGDSGAVRDQEVDRMLLEALSEEARTPEQVKEDAGLKPAARTLRRHYARLFEANRCGREGTGQRALPYTYKMLASTNRPAFGETPPTDTNKLAATTDPLVVTGWPANSGHDSEDDGQRLYALSLWQQQGRPAPLTLGEGRDVHDVEKFLERPSADDLAALIKALEAMQ